MFENLSEKLEKAFKALKGQSRITEINVSSTLKDIRRALIDADVHFKVAKELTDTVRDKAIGQKVMASVSPGQLLVKIFQDELTALMGGQAADFSLKGNPSVVLLCGLQGSGKTTFAVKLAAYLKNKNGRMPLLAACDVYRPAAAEQLRVLAEGDGLPVFIEAGNNDPLSLAEHALKYAKSSGHDVLIIDTAGRQAVDEAMMREIARLKEALKPHETIFVLDAMAGQDAVNTARAFHDRVSFDGVAVTKMDSDARGGAALSVKYVTGKPVKFIGTGEKAGALELFHPDRMAQRILGMGDIVTFVEKVHEQFDQEQAEKLQKKIRRSQLTFNDFLGQLKQVKKMGNIKDMLGMIPGMGKALKDVDINEDSFKRIEAMIASMTPDERENPELMNGSRRKRIADGSGNPIQEVNRFMKQFEEMQQMMKKMQQSSPAGRMFKGLPFMK